MKRMWFCLGLVLDCITGWHVWAGVASLEAGFDVPPPEAKPWVYWYFMDGNLTREGMTADLEAMREAGIGGAIYLEVDIGVPRGPVKFMSEEWRQHIVHAVREAERLGIELALGTGPGWCGTGGPWVTAAQSMQHLVASETRVQGPMRFEGILERPKPRKPFFGEGTLTPELAKAWRDYYQDEVVLAFPTPSMDRRVDRIDEKALYLRAPYSSQPGVRSALPMSADIPALEAGAVIPTEAVVDLTAAMDKDGKLSWEVPPGDWTVLRMGRTTTGQTTRPAPLPGLGFETDKFDSDAVDAHLNNYVGVILKELGERRPGVGGLTTLHFDSWEMSAQNWSAGFRNSFIQQRGYDPLRYLPAYTGRVVESLEATERVLWDVRQTAQELVITNHVMRLRDYAHRNGLRFSSETYDMNPCADLSLGALADVPMGEFWWLGFDTFHTVIEAASIAHTCGREIVAAESFTSDAGEDWRAHPGNLKPMGDWALAAGVNRIAFHRYQHQPQLDREPGMRMGIYGVHWERTQTWWPMVNAYHTYLARCQFLLRQGQAVADILYLTSEGAPHVFRAPTGSTVGHPPDRRGYNFDACAPEILIHRAKVENGRITFPGGTRYGVLVLPREETMSLELLQKISQLVEAGARVIGPRPKKSNGWADHGMKDTAVRALAATLWREGTRLVESDDPLDRGVGKAHREDESRHGGPDISTRYPDYEAIVRRLEASGWVPDFESDGPIRYTHRSTAQEEIYFVSNRSGTPVETTAWFRVSRRQPELWHPVWGTRRPLNVHREEGLRSSIRLKFEPHESFFVVFRGSLVPAVGRTSDFPELESARTLSGPWEVSFDAKWGAPAKVLFEELSDWSRNAHPGVRFYSGRAEYRKTFQVRDGATEAEAGRSVFLDLGSVENLARVRLNGRDLGVLWCAPWRVEVTGNLRAGANTLEIEVANLWPNRLIGDAALPPEQRRTWTTSNPYKTGAPLLPSGLLGPVTFQIQINASPSR